MVETSGAQEPNLGGRYTVVARRYRPKNFAELVGQDNVAQALATAIKSNRVGHAYLFTGARGVGKTSTARIFAKALNAPGGPNPDPDLHSDVAQAIDSGEDMDVIEIDGASNRGIEEIRQLRANVNVRPSRSRYKIYIIDEVHMLTTQAFNALLKTLEEPPEHVKFIFCTTDPEKIPITVLSRCQRFDFSPVKTEEILGRLRSICVTEGAQAEEEALRVIARRAAGSMRDSQSLLEQILSFSSGMITLEHVHQMLGTADETRLATVSKLLLARNGGEALHELERAIADGVDAGQFGEQLLGYLRDVMTLTAGASAELMRTANPNHADELLALGKSWGLATILSAVQLLDEAIVKMRHSVQSRLLLEIALIQICQLQDLQKLSELIASMHSGKSPPPPKVDVPSGAKPSTSTRSVAPNPSPKPAPAEKKNDEMIAVAFPKQVDAPKQKSALAEDANRMLDEAAASEPSKDTSRVVEALASNSVVEAVTCDEAWRQALTKTDSLISDYAALANRVIEKSRDRWEVIFPIGCELAIEYCERVEHRRPLENAVEQLMGRRIVLTLIGSDEPPNSQAIVSSPVRRASNSQRIREVREHPLIVKICDLFGGEVMRVDPPVSSPPTPKLVSSNVKNPSVNSPQPTTVESGSSK